MKVVSVYPKYSTLDLISQGIKTNKPTRTSTSEASLKQELEVLIVNKEVALCGSIYVVMLLLLLASS